MAPPQRPAAPPPQLLLCSAPPVEPHMMARKCFLVVNTGISSLCCSLALMYPSLASCPHTAAAASVTIFTHLNTGELGRGSMR